MSKKIISNQAPKGTSDWLPAEFKLRQYIFNTWRKVCLRYGYLEYLTPLVELADIYKAKSGEDVGGQELMTFFDLSGRELSIRPEMTPSVTRMVSKIYGSSPKPLKLFSIANFMRNEKPQRGRNREFWQLNCDIFGSASIAADLEILQLSLDIMEEFKAPKKSFTLRLNSRRLLQELLPFFGLKEKNGQEFFRILDKFKKLSKDEFFNRLKKIGLKEDKLKEIKALMSNDLKVIQKFGSLSVNFKEAKEEIDFIINRLDQLNYEQEIEFDPSLIRGFDYYDGLIFEVFDNNPNNLRAMFGGGRYNGLAEIFGSSSFPAVGFAPGDETTKLFLESWDLIPKNLEEKDLIYFPLLSADLLVEAQVLAKRLRKEGKMINFAFETQRLSKALDLANKQNYDYLLIFGNEEKAKNIYKLKDMKTGQEKVYKY
jgi:histidyl-tRNA synthetase